MRVSDMKYNDKNESDNHNSTKYYQGIWYNLNNRNKTKLIFYCCHNRSLCILKGE